MIDVDGGAGKKKNRTRSRKSFFCVCVVMAVSETSSSSRVLPVYSNQNSGSSHSDWLEGESQSHGKSAL